MKMTDEKQTVKLGLDVVPSKIESPGGMGRVHKEILPHLELEKGDEVLVFTKNEEGEDDKSVIVSLAADDMIDSGSISLRKPELERLGVENGSKVFVKAHTTVSEVLRDYGERVSGKIKGAFSGDDEKEDDKKEDDKDDKR